MIPPSPLLVSKDGVRLDQILGIWLVGIHFEIKGFCPFPKLLLARGCLLLAPHLHEIGVPILRVVRLDGWMEGIGSKLDLEVKGVVCLSDFVDGARDFFLSDETEGTVLRGAGGEWGCVRTEEGGVTHEIVDNGEVDLLCSHCSGFEVREGKG